MTAAKRQPATPRNFDPPPKVVEGMVQDISGINRGRYRQTKAADLRNYADAGQIYEEHLQAGELYQRWWYLKHPEGRDSTDLDRIKSLGAVPGGISAAQSDAIRKLMAVDSRMSENDRLIVRMVVGKGHTATEAVSAVTKQGVKHFPIPRFREAMDNLVTAIARSNKEGWTFLLTVVNRNPTNSAG